MTKFPYPVGDEILPNRRTALFPTDASTQFLYLPLLNEMEDRVGGHAVVVSSAPFRNHRQNFDGITNFMEFENNGLDNPTADFAFTCAFISKKTIGLAQICSIGDTTTNDLAWACLIQANNTPLTAVSVDGTATTLLSGGNASVEKDRPSVFTFFKYNATQEFWVNGRFGKSGSAPATIFDSSGAFELGRNPVNSRHYDMDFFWAVIQNGEFTSPQSRREYHARFLNPNLVIDL